jgi:acid phosphatase (class A)
MIKSYLFVSVFSLVTSVTSTAQKSNAQPFTEKPLTAIRGHYAHLAKFNGLPRKENAVWDDQKFPSDPSTTERRLKLKPYYLENVPAEAFGIPAPPANSSEQTRAELNYLLQLQNQRTKIDVDASLAMASVYYSPSVKPEDSHYAALRKNLFFIGRSMGTWFQPDSLPVTANFMAHVWQDASFYIWSLKLKYLRVRPYKLEPKLKNLEETDWAAYPSGHAANSYINAYIYQELAPEFADVFLKDAYDMAHSREILGVHYPSDSEASRILARAIVNALSKNEKFQRDLTQVREEWATKTRGYFGGVIVGEADHISTPGSSCGTKTASKTVCDTN